MSSHRITLDGGFVVVYGKDRQDAGQFPGAARVQPGQPAPWLDEGEPGRPFRSTGRSPQILLSAAQRSDEPVLRVAGQEYALGMAATASGKVVVVALPMPQGLSQTAARIRSGAAEYWQLFRSRNQHSHHVLPHAVADHGLRLLLQRLAGAVSLQADYAAG